MANRLKVAVVDMIDVLGDRGWSQRRIARTLGIDRGTVARHFRIRRDAAVSVGADRPETSAGADPPGAVPPGRSGGAGPPGAFPGDSRDTPAKAAKAPPGSESAKQGVCETPANSKPATAGAEAPPGSSEAPEAIETVAEPGCWAAPGSSADPAEAPPGLTAPNGSSAIPGQVAVGTPSPSQTSLCEPFREMIQEKIDQGLSARRIFQDLVADHGFGAKYHSVRRFVNRLQHSRPLPFRRIEVAPGEEAQVDFGTGAPVIGPDGKRRRTHVLRVVLSHSRKAYSESVFRQSTDEFIHALENAFWHFGGVPKTLVPDNLKAAVIKADWFDPELNPKIQVFCRHYSTVMLPTKPRMPRHKGKTEAGVKFVQSNALKGRSFGSLEEQNRFLREWEANVADTRIHGTTRKQVGKFFEDVERAALEPLPIERFPFFHEAQRSVHRDGHVEVDKSYYSVPPEFVTRRVWVRWDSRTVRIFDMKMNQIAMHVKHEPGKFSTRPVDICSEKISPVERGASYWLSKATIVGPHTQRWSESMIQERGIEGVRVLVGLISLAKKHRGESIEKACETAESHGVYRLRTIRELIKRQAPRQQLFEFMQEHEIIRDLSDYGDFVQNAFRKEYVV